MSKNAKIFVVLVLFMVVGIIIASKEKPTGCLFQRHLQPPAPVIADANVSEVNKPVQASTVTQIPESVAEKKLPRLVDLGAGKCIPCKMMKPILDELKASYKERFEVVFIDIGQNPNEAKEFNINLIPTQIFFDASGKELFRHEGFYSKEEILSKWKELGVAL